MRIAYLLHTDREYDEIIETVTQLTKQDDHVFIMINDDDLRAKIQFVYADAKKVHLSQIQEFAQEGDMSMARGTIIQMREAVAMGFFDYFINLTDGMMPLKSRSEIVAFLKENEGKDFFYVEKDENEDPSIRTQAMKYYTFTNLLAFPKGKYVRAFTRGNANFFNAIGLRKKTMDKVIIGSPWFMISRKTAQILADHFDYVSETFKLSWYAEEMYIPMMVNMFVPDCDHVNKDYRAIGPDGSWIASQSALPLTQEIINAHPEALFGGQILVDENPALYGDYFDIYNSDIKEKE